MYQLGTYLRDQPLALFFNLFTHCAMVAYIVVRDDDLKSTECLDNVTISYSDREIRKRSIITTLIYGVLFALSA